MIRNLEKHNIFNDGGEVPNSVISDIENQLQIRLPLQYSDFIRKHNEADLNARIFDYKDLDRNTLSSDAFAFIDVCRILNRISNVKSGEDPDWDVKYRFEDGLIPFGENGGGDMICFDYRNNNSTDNPPIVMWNHDMGLEHRVVFIANNFESFINMLYEPED